MNSHPASFQVWMDAVCAQQDYLWFLAIVAAGAALLAWWRHPRRHERRWIACGAMATILHSVVGIAAFLAPFVERENPEPGGLPPHLFADLLMAAAAMLCAVGWWWMPLSSRKVWRCLGPGVVVLAWGLRIDHPATGGWILAVALTVTLPLILRRESSRLAIAAALLTVAAMWLSPWGPVAAAASVLQRWRDWSVLSIASAALLGGAQITALISLLQDIVMPLPDEQRKELKQSLRPFLIGAGVWLMAGFFLAMIVARYARQSFESAALSRVVTAAAVFPTEMVEKALGPEFRLSPAGLFYNSNGHRVPLFKSESTANRNVQSTMEHLHRLFELNPDFSYASIALPHGDQLLDAIPMKQTEENSGLAYPIRPLTPEDRERWRKRAPHLEIATTPSGTMFMARAPLLSAAGRPIGWLQFEFNIGLWAAAQAQARLLTFAAVAMGLGLVSLSFLRQWRERDREAALRAAAAAQAANQLKTTFLASVSHELRTPIQSILGYAELLHRSLRNEIDQTRLSALRQHGELMIRLVNDLIDLGMLDSGAFRLVEKTFALKRLVQEVVDSLAPRADAKGLQMVCRIDEEVATWVDSDPERLRQILLNLVGNAVKYTESGRVDVLLSCHSEEPGFQKVELVVRDTGPGIRPEERQRLFEPFSRLANAERKEGAGLGLALTAGLCRRLGDGLAVESDGKSGSLFRTTLRFRVSTAPPDRSHVASDALAGWRILVADDNAFVRELFVAYLSELGAECVAVANGADAVAEAADARFGAIVLDLSMPGLDGSEVARRVRAAGGRQRIVGVSAHAGGAERETALAAGMDDFLLKPIELPALAEALGRKAPAAPVDDVWTLRREQWAAALRQELPDALAQISSALEQAAWPLLQQRAHHLKNSAMVVRDDDLFAACGEIELAARCEDAPAAQAAWSGCLRAAARWSSPPKEFRPHSRPLQPKPSTQF